MNSREADANGIILTPEGLMHEPIVWPNAVTQASRPGSFAACTRSPRHMLLCVQCDWNLESC